MNILRWLDKLLFSDRFNQEDIELRYKELFVRISKANTLSELYETRKVIDELCQLTTKTKLTWMVNKNTQLKKLWNRKYKLWKSRG
jgi:hypothetical protein